MINMPMDSTQTQPRFQEGQRAAGDTGGGQGGRAHTTTDQREISNATLDMGDQLLSLVFNAFLFTEAGRKLLMSEAATEHLVVFAVSLAAFNQLALVLRLNFHSLTSVIICDCSAFLRVMMFMSLLGTFVKGKLPWITYAPLIFLPLLLLSALARLRTAGGGDVDGGRALAAARKEISDAMLAKTEQILKPIVAAFLATEEGRQLLLSEGAAPHLTVFVLSIVGFKFMAHIRGHDFTPFVSADFIDDCCAFLKVTIFMSLTGIFMHSKLPMITHTPLLFLLLLLLRALVHIYKSWGLDNEEIGTAHMD